MCHHETYLPTQQEKKTAQIRFPQTHENCQRPCRPQASPSSGPQAPHCVTLQHPFPKAFRLRKRSQYLQLLRDKRRWKGQFVTIDFRLNTASPAKLGITVTKKFGKAVQRNRFKRIVREAFRKEHHNFPPDIELNIHPRPAEGACCSRDIAQDFEAFLQWIRAKRTRAAKQEGAAAYATSQ